jgi:hypothetical protein
MSQKKKRPILSFIVSVLLIVILWNVFGGKKSLSGVNYYPIPVHQNLSTSLDHITTAMQELKYDVIYQLDSSVQFKKHFKIDNATGNKSKQSIVTAFLDEGILTLELDHFGNEGWFTDEKMDSVFQLINDQYETLDIQ